MSARKRFEAAKSIERRYYSVIYKLMLPIIDHARPYADDVDEMARAFRLASLTPEYQRAARDAVLDMTMHINAESLRDWRAHIRQSHRGREIRQLLESEIQDNLSGRMRELIDFNAKILYNMPENIAVACARHLATESMQGRRASELSEALMIFLPHHTKAYARMVARTEVSRASSALTQARAEDLGIRWYEWKTSEDGSVRDSHRYMHEVLIPYAHAPIPEKLDKRVKLKKYPAPYHAGNYYNCRCYQAPIVDVNDVQFPHRVFNYRANRVERMTLRQFKRLQGIEEDA